MNLEVPSLQLLRSPQVGAEPNSSDRPLASHAADPSIFLSLVVPTYNEAANVGNLVRTICTLLDRYLPDRYELIIVDDNSPDRTWEKAQTLQPDYPQLVVIRRQQERGLATAVIRGWQQAQGNVLGVIDGDLQHPPEVLQKLITAIAAGADLAAASRYAGDGGVGSWNGVRQFLSRGAVRLALWILPEITSRLSDPMSGYFLVRREAIANQPLDPIGYKILLEVMGRGRIDRVAEVGYTFAERQEGESKVSWQHYQEFIRHLLRLRFATGNVPVGRMGRFLRFCLVGFSGVFVNIFGSFLLIRYAGLGKITSKTIAVAVAIVNNFIWNDVWTFSDASKFYTGWRSRLVRFLRFSFACGLGALIDIGIFALLDHFGMPWLAANLIAIAGSTAWNYLINLKFNWKTK
ncbi:glycosyltransferase [Thalassoporum mexicanum]|uniref:glycosyltransferase n=1 Tax=Thalassoporum mexicanum TaxID=3457544 RepID=UPI000316D45A